MFEQIKAGGFKYTWNMREVHKVTQWKDDCIYRTKSLGFIICLPDYELLDHDSNGRKSDARIGSCSTKVSKELMK